MTAQRFKLTIEYDGAPFSGWQRQDGVPSVQGAMEDALRGLFQENIGVTVAGRTDAGVHARGQVAHCDLADTRGFDGPRLVKAVNAHLRHVPVAVVAAETVTADFHARFSAVNKLYRYVVVARSAPPVLMPRAWHVYKLLDVDAMRAAAAHLIGHHDFTTFRDTDCQAKSPLRTLDRLDIAAAPCDGYGGMEITFDVEGRSFLHHQVRNMVGTLALVGQGRWQPDDVKAALDARDRTKGGPTAPAQGLCLVRVDY